MREVVEMDRSKDRRDMHSARTGNWPGARPLPAADRVRYGQAGKGCRSSALTLGRGGFQGQETDWVQHQ